MKNALILISTLLFCSAISAETYVGLDFATSKPAGYNECPCPPDFELKPIRAEFDSSNVVLRIGHKFSNGIFVEGRHGRGLKKNGSEIEIKDSFSFPGIDVKLRHFSYAGVGYEFMQDKAFSPYVSVGKLLNFVMDGYDPESGTKILTENYDSFAFGAGVNWSFSENWTVNVDVQNYSRGNWGKDGGLDFTSYSAGFAYHF